MNIEYQNYITPSDLIELNYCNRFIYYMKNLLISQKEDKRYKVQKGRDVHDKKASENKTYFRKKLNVIDKKINVELFSKENNLRGVVDEILFLKEGKAVPLDYKFAKYNGIVYDTYKIQMIMYALMIEEVYKTKVTKAYLLYCVNNELVEINISDRSKEDFLTNIMLYKRIVDGFYPPKTKYSKRCIDCCYRNICVK